MTKKILLNNEGQPLSIINKCFFAIYKSRGMQSTIYVEMAPGVRIEDLYQQLKLSYEVYLFISLLVTYH